MSRAVTVLSRYLSHPLLMRKSRMGNNSTDISFCLDGLPSIRVNSSARSRALEGLRSQRGVGNLLPTFGCTIATEGGHA